MIGNLVTAALVLGQIATTEIPRDAVPPGRVDAAKVQWHDGKSLTVEGMGWSDTLSDYDRLPAKAEAVVRPPVWSLSRHSAGVALRFATDATAVSVHWTLTSDRLAMPHMAATGVSGVDLYVHADGRWRWLAAGRPEMQENTAALITGLPAARREYVLYLPLYNGVRQVEIGTPAGASVWPGAPRPAARARPLVFWGTSITQGGCASRTGMAHPAIVGRRLDRPVINLGFSGNGKLEPEMADLIAELDAAVFILDCLPNLTAEEVRERTEPAVRRLRRSHPDTPILLVEDRTYANAFLDAARRRRNQTSRAALREAYQRLLAEGVTGLHLLPGEQLLGEDGEDTVDGSHPTDLGFLRQADAFQAALEQLLDD